MLRGYAGTFRRMLPTQNYIPEQMAATERVDVKAWLLLCRVTDVNQLPSDLSCSTSRTVSENYRRLLSQLTQALVCLLLFRECSVRSLVYTPIIRIIILWFYLELRRLWRREKSLSPVGIRNLDRSARALDTASIAGHFSNKSLKHKFWTNIFDALNFRY